MVLNKHDYRENSIEAKIRETHEKLGKKNLEGTFENPIKINNLKQFEALGREVWVEIYGRKEFKTNPLDLFTNFEKRSDRQYTIPIELSQTGVELANINHYAWLPFEESDYLIHPTIKESFRIGCGLKGDSRIVEKLNCSGYKNDKKR